MYPPLWLLYWSRNSGSFAITVYACSALQCVTSFSMAYLGILIFKIATIVSSCASKNLSHTGFNLKICEPMTSFNSVFLKPGLGWNSSVATPAMSSGIQDTYAALTVSLPGNRCLWHSPRLWAPAWARIFSARPLTSIYRWFNAIRTRFFFGTELFVIAATCYS